ncbi:Predicted protein [Taphrina deformans PYCC 5710]|uniref:FAD-binding PCMH-type domain-containing protein n=1 Tax=Taphrina deformans (strain PYCC 5710 / ATCC 11124 / CBS 356.35 / IMI 108563 / JCM 9778 / NBRC 8474) TaxID=1097556 RepID=R4XHK2_TAPDE|nr:Predicted protein [Taphrina deformans PYCC 5710]|eukprot:CCG85154.1 Predicted protein [Taphrina deformans PYCC 5710]
MRYSIALVLVQLHSVFAAATPSACQQISSQILGDVYYRDTVSANYYSDISHYMTSSSQNPACVVEVASAEDVSTVMKIVGATKTPFSVKCGGHASNPGFSSTPGVFISMVRLKSISLASDKSSVTFGTGNIWSDLYSALDGTDVNVVGGRVTGPGTAGFTLGGGYSWLTDQYGLTCDTVINYQLVLPNGTITTVDSSTPDLNFALKGGLNRFGIVTEMTLKAVPQVGNVYGGISLYSADQIPSLLNATEVFQRTNTDPKAQVIVTLNGGPVGQSAILLTYYDGPSKPAAFAPFDKPFSYLSTAKPQSFLSFSKVTPSQLSGGNRGAFHTLMTTDLTLPFMEAVYNETKHYSGLARKHGASLLSYDIEPFGKYGQYAVDSAFPHASSPLPLNLYFAWSSLDAGEDAFWRAQMQTSIDTLTQVAMDEGIYAADPAYPNYALSTYSGAQLYGETNAARLRDIKAAVDPDGVMDLAGGFTF